jgi:hypothetical protein
LLNVASKATWEPHVGCAGTFVPEIFKTVRRAAGRKLPPALRKLSLYKTLDLPLALLPHRVPTVKKCTTRRPVAGALAASRVQLRMF